MLSRLSPRGRGKRAWGGYKMRALRSIPAWAGETGFPPWPGITITVYPRVGGGNRWRGCQRALDVGLSPRGRGKLRIAQAQGQQVGSIPAWAGETRPAGGSPPAGRVYPRVGGGNRPSPFPQESYGGLSPRGRGKPLRDGTTSRPSRSIPAWAGETQPQVAEKHSVGVYPRVGGGNDCRLGHTDDARGLSPRGRGKLGQRETGHPGKGSIPAWAGETARKWWPMPSSKVYPRVGGGNSAGNRKIGFVKGLSPRGRGKRLRWL